MNLLEMTSDLVRAQVSQRNIDAASIDTWLRRTHDTMLSLWQREHVPRVEPAPSEPVDWRATIHETYIICLECRDHFRQIGGRHLASHGLDVRGYRRKYGIPPEQSLSARRLTRRRREVALNTQPWKWIPRRRERKTDEK